MAQGTSSNRAAGGDQSSFTMFLFPEAFLPFVESTRCGICMEWKGGGSSHLSAGHPGGERGEDVRAQITLPGAPLEGKQVCWTAALLCL